MEIKHNDAQVVNVSRQECMQQDTRHACRVQSCRVKSSRMVCCVCALDWCLALDTSYDWKLSSVEIHCRRLLGSTQFCNLLYIPLRHYLL